MEDTSSQVNKSWPSIEFAANKFLVDFTTLNSEIFNPKKTLSINSNSNTDYD